MTIPVVDLRRRLSRLGDALPAAWERIAASGRLIQGDELDQFEREWASFTGRSHAICLGSGTDALTLALRAVGVGESPNDEVIVPAFTAMATLAAVCAAGARPVPVDVDMDTAGMDPAAAAAAVTEATRAVVPVHLYGRPCAVPSLGVPAVEDASQAHGAFTGPSTGIAVTYSFYPTKNLGGIGDGGAVVTDDDELAARLRTFRDQGRTGDGRFAVVSRASRMAELQAAALRAFLPMLPADNERRREIARRYRKAAPQLSWVEHDAGHVYHLCVARERDRLSGPLPFATAIHYPRACTEEPAYAQFTRHPCPHAEEWARGCVTVPCFPEMTDDEVDTVAEALSALS